MGYIVIIIILLAIGLYIKANPDLKTPKSRNTSTKRQNNNTPVTQERTDYKDCYQPKYLLTKNEWYEYKKLKQYAEIKGLQVCPKVRLLDIIEPRAGQKDYKSLMGKIQSKHIDFLICTPDLRIKAILELDDNSHNQDNRRERDQFVDEILSSVGYKVIHTHYITEDTLNEL